VAGKPLQDGAGGLAIADELIVGFRAGVDAQQAELAVVDAGGEIVWRGRATGYCVVRFDDAAAAAAGAAVLAVDPAVAEVLPSRVGTGAGVGTSPGPVDKQWNLWALDVDPGEGWGDTGGMPIAVLDTGVAFEDHSDALGDYAVAPDLALTPIGVGWDFINDDAHANDDQGHGTHVAGVIAASAEHGIYPTGLGSQIIPIKVLDGSNQGTELALAEGIHWAVDHGARVINMSLAFPPAFYPSRFLQAAVDAASRAGVVMVAAVGNHGADVVTYPAAFREVIAVGASKLRSSFDHDADDDDPWQGADRSLRAAPYSNRSARVDVSAPGGVIDQDIDGDGNPEAILAQTFGDDPTEFDYYYYAGTSQAAAQVSGLVAHMLTSNPDLTPFEIRQVLGESARRKNWRLLSTDIGRGFVQADNALKDARKSQQHRDRFYATIYLTLHRKSGRHWADARVEVIDESGKPARWMKVWGTFTGGVFANVHGWTDWNGVVRFKTKKQIAPLRLVGFQVEAVADHNDFDRPLGFLRTDSCSLEMLSQFANSQGVGTSPGPNLLTLNYRLVPNTPSDQLDTFTLLNFTWDLATVPTTVAVDAEWFLQTYPDAADLTVGSHGTGVGTSPIQITSAQSFAPGVTLPWGQPPAPCTDLLVRTFASGTGEGMAFLPLVSDPDGSCDDANNCGDVDDVLAEMWMAWGAGVGTSPGPVYSPSMGITAQSFAELESMVKSYADFQEAGAGSPVDSYGAVLGAAGLSVVPMTPIDDEGTGITAMSD
jgi:serine protease